MWIGNEMHESKVAVSVFLYVATKIEKFHFLARCGSNLATLPHIHDRWKFKYKLILKYASVGFEPIACAVKVSETGATSHNRLGPGAKPTHALHRDQNRCEPHYGKITYFSDNLSTLVGSVLCTGMERHPRYPFRHVRVPPKPSLYSKARRLRTAEASRYKVVRTAHRQAARGDFRYSVVAWNAIDRSRTVQWFIHTWSPLT